MTQVLLTAFAARQDAIALATDTVRTLVNRGVDASVVLLDDGVFPVITRDVLVVSLGGDGTFLQAARYAHQFDARILAVNLGRIGFLLDVRGSELVESIVGALGHDEADERLALEVSLENGTTAFALNEVVVERKAAGHMVRVTTFVDDEEFLTYSADGVMVSTPTGSTGYNFSAGGPIVDANLPLMIVTPVAPHFTIDRSLVVNASQVVRLQAGAKPALVVADSHVVGTLEPGHAARVKRSDQPVRVVRSGAFSMGIRLRQSLREGHA
jgi:NAD+ kinase